MSQDSSTSSRKRKSDGKTSPGQGERTTKPPSRDVKNQDPPRQIGLDVRTGPFTIGVKVKPINACDEIDVKLILVLVNRSDLVDNLEFVGGLQDRLQQCKQESDIDNTASEAAKLVPNVHEDNWKDIIYAWVTAEGGSHGSENFSQPPHHEPFQGQFPVEDLDARINNKGMPAFEEREVHLQEIHQYLAAAKKAKEKPLIGSLFSPRGSGKTSLIRNLVLEDLSVRSLLTYGRVLVVDAMKLKDLNYRTPITVLRVLVLYHLSRIFDNFSVTDGDSVISFTSLAIDAADRYLNSLEESQRELHPSFQAWIRRLRNLDELQVYGEWLRLTSAAFRIDSNFDSHNPMIIVDQCELLARDDNLFGCHTNSGAKKTRLTMAAEAIPLGYPALFFGTSNLLRENQILELDPDASKFDLEKLLALPGLSLEATMTMAEKYRFPVTEKQQLLRVVWHVTGGVPRLLHEPFEPFSNPKTRTALADTAQVVLDGIQKKIARQYEGSLEWFKKNSGEGLLVLLCAAVRFPVPRDGDVPGTTVPVSSLFKNAAAFDSPGLSQSTATLRVPEPWWDREAMSKALRTSHFAIPDLDDLIPNYVKILHSPPGADKAGLKWERQCACALAVRYKLLQLANYPGDKEKFVRFTELYPCQGHLHAVLSMFEVCLKDGVIEKSSVTVETKNYENFNVYLSKSGAHHDMLLPARRISSGSMELIAFSTKYGNEKPFNEIVTGTKQHLMRKPVDGDDDVGIYPGVLIQLASGSVEGKQGGFRKSKGQKNVLEQMQDAEPPRYALMNGREIVAYVDYLELFKNC